MSARPPPASVYPQIRPSQPQAPASPHAPDPAPAPPAAAAAPARPAEPKADEFKPNSTLDRISTAAIFALYPLLPPKTKFGINKHVIEIQESKIIPYLSAIPMVGEIDAQSVVRKMRGNSREETGDFAFAINDALKWYGNHPGLQKILDLVKAGLDAYALTYPHATAKDSLALSKLHIEHLQAHKQVPEVALKDAQNQVKNFWSVKDIDYLVILIARVFEKKQANENFEEELKTALFYIDLKQRKVVPLLEREAASYLA